ncbi:MAG: GNAT family N-acetyltransferase [Candidatus Latescibacterota bacterium]|nr:GNAT family N-acetyltransferase [Candidatus Latescibacterota bacterium]
MTVKKRASDESIGVSRAEAGTEIREVDDARCWDDFASSAVGATPFSTSPFLQCAAAGWQTPHRAFGAFRHGRLVAGVTGLESNRHGFRRLSTPELFPHTGFLFRPAQSARPAAQESEWSQALRTLLPFLKDRYAQIRLSCAPAINDLREASWDGWSLTPRYTYQVELPGDRQKLWESFERRTRTTVRKAEREGYRVEAGCGIGEIVRLYQLVYNGTAPPVAPSILERCLDSIQSQVEIWRIDSTTGETASAVVFVRWQSTLYAWLAGANPAFRDTGATTLLYWKILESTSATCFDFVGANMQAIALFKRGFGGRVVNYLSLEGFGSPVLRRLSLLRRALQ